MSFITKRERVFNDYELYDLPARNECKLKEYGSCTDARAWSHFTTDKTEHLVDVIKRNNEKCTPKYVPTKVIVDTLMAPKNAEITRLRRKISQFERIIAVYDQLDLNPAQRNEIARAHEALITANKNLDDMCTGLDLNISGFTEGMDSENYETGTSRADESDLSRGDDVCGDMSTCEWTKSVLVGGDEEKIGDENVKVDASTYARDTRVDELQEVIITKDARLSAMQNTIAVMENDVCEPYCIYAHIYTAIEKIFGILCQNDKYKHYLDLLTKGKNIRQIDIKGKILYKMKVLEKFSLALIAPCTREETSCSCYPAEITTLIATSYALSSNGSKQTQNTNQRSELVADVMGNKQVIEILDSNSLTKVDATNDDFIMDDDSMNTENLNRLKNLQVNYEDLVSCYENMCHQRNCLSVQCQRYNELENELQVLRVQLREYNLLWNEKEHFKNRSNDLDDLKQKYLILCDETSNIELELKAAAEINNVKSSTLESLRAENMLLERRLNEASIAFEKEKSALMCKLKETDCTVICQKQQIKSLSVQVDSFIEQQDPHNETGEQDTQHSLILLKEIETLKEQISYLKYQLNCSEEENQDSKDNFQINTNLINELRQEVEHWKKNYEDLLDRNTNLANDNQSLIKDVEDRKRAVENLMTVIESKSEEINFLLSEIELKSADNRVISQKLQKYESTCSLRVEVLENDLQNVLGSLKEAQIDSQELLNRVQNSDQKFLMHDNEKQYWENEAKKRESINSLLTEENNTLRDCLFEEKNINIHLLHNIQRLSDSNNIATTNIDTLLEEKNEVEKSLQLERKSSNIIEEKFEDLATQTKKLKQEHENILSEKKKLEAELIDKNKELNMSNAQLQLKKKESEELVGKVEQTNSLQIDLSKVREENRMLLSDKKNLQSLLDDKDNQITRLSKLLEENKVAEKSLQLERKSSYILEEKLSKFRDLAAQMEAMKQEHKNNLEEKTMLEAELSDKNKQLNMSNLRLKLQKNESEELVDKLELANGLHLEFSNINEENKTLLSDKQILKKQIEDKDNQIMNLTKNLDELGSNNLEKLQEISKLKHDLDKLQKQFDEKSEEINILHNDLESKMQENVALMSHLQALELQNNAILTKLSYTETDNKDKQISIEAMRKESVQLVEQLKQHDRLEAELEELKRALHETEQEKYKLKTDFDTRLSEFQRLEKENCNLKSQDENLRTCNADLKSSLETTKNELLHSKSNQDAYEVLRKEIEEMRNEKLKNLTTIRELLDKRDENEELISRLNEDLMKKDEKNAILQNCNNNLQDEIRRLHDYLGTAVTAGEEINENKNNLMNESLKKVEAHHSKATHNIKMELAKLKNDKLILEEKLSDNQIRGDDENRHKLKQLQQEKEMYVTELKELEIETVGDSRLSPERCNLEDLIASINNIRKTINAKLSKTSSLEHAIQSSSQLLLSKTYEAKRCIEKEKQKMLAEKEEALQERLMLEKQMLNLKESLEHQITRDKNTINDLQGEIANQKLEMKKLNERTKSYISKLEGELQSIKDLYENAKKNINSQQTNIQLLDQGKAEDMSMIDALNLSLETKTKELTEMQDEIATIKAKVFKNAEIQVDIIIKPATSEETIETVSLFSDKISGRRHSPTKNEVEILTATIVPTLETFRNNYIHEKMRKLSISPVEKSILDGAINSKHELNHSDMQLPRDTSKANKINGRNFKLEPDHMKTFPQVNAGLVLENIPGSESLIPEQTITSSSNAMSRDRELNLQSSSSSNIYNNNDIFTINRDSDSSNGTKSLNEYVNETKQKHSYSKTNLIVEAVTVPELIMPYSPSYQTQGPSGNNRPLSTREIAQEDKNRKDLTATQNKVLSQNVSNTSIRNDVELTSYVQIGTEKSTNKYENDISFNSKMTRSTKKKDFLLDLPSSIESGRHIEVTGYDDSTLKKTQSEGIIYEKRKNSDASNRSSFTDENKSASNYLSNKSYTQFSDKAVLVKTDSSEDYESKIRILTKALENIERDSKNKIESIKQQYDTNIKSVINEHNQGVKNMQSLHEETLNDILRTHENEVENLRTMSIEAMRKAEKMESENLSIKSKFCEQYTRQMEQEPTRMTRQKKQKSDIRDSSLLTKTDLQAIDVKPRSRTLGPCTCSPDLNLSDTIRNIFEQVDVEQRKTAEHTYLKYIANKILSGSVESLDADELSFLHYKVCRSWKVKTTKEEALQRRIDSLETELINKQHYTVQHIAELDRKVAEERSRLQEVRDAVCRTPPTTPPPSTDGLVDKNIGCNGSHEYGVCQFKGHPSAGHLPVPVGLRPRRTRPENHRAVLAQLVDDRVERQPYTYDPFERRLHMHDYAERRPLNRVSPERRPLSHMSPERRPLSHQSPERRPLSHVSAETRPYTHVSAETRRYTHVSAERRPYTNEPPTRLRRSNERTSSARAHRK